MAGPSVGDMKTLRHQVSADEPWVARLEIVSMFVCSDIFHSDTLKQSVQLSADYVVLTAYLSKLTLVLYEKK